MLLVDDVLLAPIAGILFVFREVHKAVVNELSDTKPIVQQLQELYMLLETGKLSAEEFDLQEAILLDRLDQAEKGGEGP